MFKNCQKYNISPADLYEELHYQLPEEWIVSLRYIIKCSVRQEIKNEGFQTESTSELEVHLILGNTIVCICLYFRIIFMGFLFLFFFIFLFFL